MSDVIALLDGAKSIGHATAGGAEYIRKRRDNAAIKPRMDPSQKCTESVRAEWLI
jgi:hypothetical protein